MILKLAFQQQIHMYYLPEDATYLSLVAFARKVFNNLPVSFHFTYFDSEEDELTVNCQQDVAALKQSEREGVKIIKLQIKEEICLLDDVISLGEISDHYEEIPSNSFSCGDIDQSGEDSIKVIACSDREVNQSCQYENEQFLDNFLLGAKCEKEEQDLVADTVREYLRVTEEKIIAEMTEKQEETEILQSEIDRYLQKLLIQCEEKYIQYKEGQDVEKVKSEQINPNEDNTILSKQNKTDTKLDDLVDKIIKTALPGIIDQVTDLVKQKLQEDNPQQTQCANCLRQQLSLQRLITQSLLQKLRS